MPKAIVQKWDVVDCIELGELVNKTLSRSDWLGTRAGGWDISGNGSVERVDVEQAVYDREEGYASTPTVEEWLEAKDYSDRGGYFHPDYKDQPSVEDMALYLNKNHGYDFPMKFHYHIWW